MARFSALMAICCLHMLTDWGLCSDLNSRLMPASGVLAGEKTTMINSGGTYEDPSSSGSGLIRNASNRKKYMALYYAIAPERMVPDARGFGLMRFNSTPYFLRHFGAPRSPAQITSAIERMLQRYAEKSGRWDKLRNFKDENSF